MMRSSKYTRLCAQVGVSIFEGFQNKPATAGVLPATWLYVAGYSGHNNQLMIKNLNCHSYLLQTFWNPELLIKWSWRVPSVNRKGLTLHWNCPWWVQKVALGLSCSQEAKHATSLKWCPNEVHLLLCWSTHNIHRLFLLKGCHSLTSFISSF